MNASPQFVLRLACPDTRGIVHAVSGFLVEHGCNIIDSQQCSEPLTGTFCMRVQFAQEAAPKDLPGLRGAFEAIAKRFGMRWNIDDLAVRPRVAILVSRYDHCLVDLLYRHRKGALAMEIVAVISNHRDTYQLTAAHDIPFHHLPVTPETKVAQEHALLGLLAEYHTDLTVLARYMQVLTDDACRQLSGRVINIHHSFLPGFKGARPYHQAYERGVKLIGATAHYVTPDLDEGPIIEQDVARVDHRQGPDELAAVGRDIEQQVLARAVRWHIEHRIMMVGSRTVVFR
jgi:formyltetrahydrofolate deformylase